MLWLNPRTGDRCFPTVAVDHITSRQPQAQHTDAAGLENRRASWYDTYRISLSEGPPLSASAEVQRRFLATVSGWIVSLPHDLRVLLEAKDDPNLDRPARETAAGAILYVLNPDSLGGDNEVVEYADDAILVRAALDA